MQAAAAYGRTKSSTKNYRNSQKGQRATGTAESENSKNKAKGPGGRNDDISDMGPQDFDDLELQKSIQGSTKGPRRAPEAQRYSAYQDRKLKAAYQSKSQVLGDS